MSWDEFFEVGQWLLLIFLFIKCAYNEMRVDRLEEK